MSFGKRLRGLRNEHRLSQSELALELGISCNAISQYETDKRFPDKDMLVKICKYFNASSDYLLGLTNITKSSPAFNKLSEKCNHFSDQQIDAFNELLKVLDLQKNSTN